MSGSQLLKTAAGIPIYLAGQVVVKGKAVAYRLVDAIDPEQKNIAAEKVAAALEGNEMLSEETKKDVKAVEITSMPHESPMDPVPHVSVTVQMNPGAEKKAHVPSDGGEQQSLETLHNGYDPEPRFKRWGEELGQEAQDMISGMTNLDPTARLTVDQVLSHLLWQEDA